MRTFDSWLHILLVVVCFAGSYLVWKVRRESWLVKFTLSVALAVYGLITFIGVIFKVLHFQLARGF